MNRPQSDPDARQQAPSVVAAPLPASPLLDLIRDEIQARGGWMGFERFMELALYAPGLGYYSGGRRVLGHRPQDGSDFVTAPELTPLFGEVLARQLGQALKETNTREIWEFGAGTGALAEQLLGELGDQIDRYVIVDLSGALRERQHERLLVLTSPDNSPDRVARLWVNLAKRADGLSMEVVEVNGLPGLVFRDLSYINSLDLSSQRLSTLVNSTFSGMQHLSGTHTSRDLPDDADRQHHQLAGVGDRRDRAGDEHPQPGKALGIEASHLRRHSRVGSTVLITQSGASITRSRKAPCRCLLNDADHRAQWWAVKDSNLRPKD